MKTKAMKMAFILTILLTMLACSTLELGDISSSTNSSKATFTGKTEIDVIELDIKPDMQTNILNINKLEVDKGKIYLRLINPDGDVINRETLTAPTEFSEQYDLDIIPGTWKLELEMHEASGSYDIKWDGKN